MGTTNYDKLDVDELDVAGVDVTDAIAEMATLDGLTATAAELNMAADISSNSAEYTVTAPAAIPTTVQYVELNHASTAIEKTIASLVPHRGFMVVKNTSASGTAAHTVTVTTGTWDGTNKVITLNAPKECIIVHIDSAGNGTIVENVGEVGLS